MKKKFNLIFGALLAGTLLVSGCDSGGDKSAENGNAGSYASKTPDAGQPIDNNELLAQYQEKLKQNPNDWQALVGLADSYFGLRRFDEAVEYYKKAVEVNPDDVDSYNDLALSSHYLGRSADALKYADKGLEKNPYYQRIWLTKGFILAYGTGELDQARAAWLKAKTLDPENPIGKAAADFLSQFDEAHSNNLNTKE